MSTIFITGSSSGIGKASAKLFAKKGWTVDGDRNYAPPGKGNRAD